MITIRPKKFVDYNSLKNVCEKVVYYPKIFRKITSQRPTDIKNCLPLGLVKMTNRVFTPKMNTIGAISLFCACDCDFEFINRRNRKKMHITVYSGSILIFGSIFRHDWTYSIPKSCIKFYQLNPLSSIYLSIPERFKYANSISKILKPIGDKKIGRQCVDKYLHPENLLGTGCYGNVYRTLVDNKRFAIKLSKLKKHALKNPYGDNNSSWFEIRILENIIKPILRKSICPNLPLIMDKFICKNCMLNIKEESKKSECAITIIELATGDLKHYLQEYNPSEEELYSCIFQIMAGLHAIQLHGQIMNFDIKKENILYYTVEKGGYWNYKIHGKNFYVPNYGHLFVINDFGISRSMSPKYPMYKEKTDKTFRLGSRYGIVIGGKFQPLNVSSQVLENGQIVNADKIEWDNGKVSLGAQFRLKRNGRVIPIDIQLDKKTEKFLIKNNIPINTKTHKFFLRPEIIPPFEFFNDTQDAIRMFIGGKRTTQKGDHGRPSCVKNGLQKLLNTYNNTKSKTMKDRNFSTDPAQILAGYFIVSFFTPIYSKIPKNENKIERYIMS